jgi:hypothetical protein
LLYLKKCSLYGGAFLFIYLFHFFLLRKIRCDYSNSYLWRDKSNALRSYNKAYSEQHTGNIPREGKRSEIKEKKASTHTGKHPLSYHAYFLGKGYLFRVFVPFPSSYTYTPPHYITPLAPILLREFISSCTSSGYHSLLFS